MFKFGLAILGGNHDALLLSSFEGILAFFSARGMYKFSDVMSRITEN